MQQRSAAKLPQLRRETRQRLEHTAVRGGGGGRGERRVLRGDDSDTAAAAAPESGEAGGGHAAGEADAGVGVLFAVVALMELAEAEAEAEADVAAVAAGVVAVVVERRVKGLSRCAPGEDACTPARYLAIRGWPELCTLVIAASVVAR